MKWLAEAPSNIALIKYMGRKNEAKKIPANPSLSYTLKNLKSFVELELLPSHYTSSYWEPLEKEGCYPINLSVSGKNRFITHLQNTLSPFLLNKELPHFVIRSCNNFPLGTGLASSASSFAALTMAAGQAIRELTHHEPTLDSLIAASRLGSGSSCRSFYEPWVLWDDEFVEAQSYPEYDHLIHQVILTEKIEKKVSSSEAHRLVQTSRFYPGRSERATERLHAFIQSMKNKEWQNMYQIAWDEFQDMHNLFETSEPAFSYHNEDSLALLNLLRTYWDKKGDGPLITMDAGPNIHLLYRPDQQDIQEEIQQQLSSGYAHVFSS